MHEKNPPQNPSKPSPWGNYFKEFLMIFLAITLGFFVENLREDLAEKDLEREFMQEVVENLMYDTAHIQMNVNLNQYVLRGLDTLRTELQMAMKGQPNINKLYFYTFEYSGFVFRARFNLSAVFPVCSRRTL